VAVSSILWAWGDSFGLDLSRSALAGAGCLCGGPVGRLWTRQLLANMANRFTSIAEEGVDPWRGVRSCERLDDPPRLRRGSIGLRCRPVRSRAEVWDISGRSGAEPPVLSSGRGIAVGRRRSPAEVSAGSLTTPQDRRAAAVPPARPGELWAATVV
jgi:hypothetical protein